TRRPILGHIVQALFDSTGLSKMVSHAASICGCIADTRNKRDDFRLAGGQFHAMVKGSTGSTTDGKAVRTASALDSNSFALMTIIAEEGFTLCVERFHLLCRGEIRLGLFKRPKAQRIIDDSIHFAHSARVEDVLKVH